MISVGIFLLELLGYTLALRVFLGVPLAAGPAIYAAAIIVGLYVSDFLGGLKIASQLVHLGGLLALAASVAMILRSPLPEFRCFIPVSDERAGAFRTNGRVLALGHRDSRRL
jgi:Mn2+/Fe2+ NRAMP family transporter